MERYFGHYKTLFGGLNYDEIGSFELDNLVSVMQAGLPSNDWVPALLRYFDRFRFDELLPFLKLLENKFSADWIGQYSPTKRIDAMNHVIRVIENAQRPQDILTSDSFEIDADSMRRVLDGKVYGRRFARFVLLKLDYLFHNHDLRMHFETLSVEHILPQNPSEESQWMKDFTTQTHAEWVDRLGNLVLITKRKNTSQGRLDYAEKKTRYFEKRIDTCPYSLRVLNQNEHWGPEELQGNHLAAMKILCDHYGIPCGVK